MPTTNNTILEIENLPTFAYFHAHMWVDYIELLCLVNASRTVSRADVLDRVREREDLGELSGGYQDHGDNDLSDLDIESEFVGYDELGDPAAEIDDRWNQRVDDWFVHLSYREGAFDDFYPFVLNEENSEISLISELTTKHILYLFLLFSTNTRYIDPKSDRQTFYNDFEIVSLEALQQCLPLGAEAHVFGSNPRNNGRYREATLFKRIMALATDLRERVLIEESDLSPHDHGDGGLDLVAWIPMNDGVNRTIVVFGQCSCSATDWEKKQLSASHEAWRDRISLPVSTNNMAFIPLCLRNSQGGWHDKSSISSILIDRLRFVKILKDTYIVIKSQPSFEVIKRILEINESIF